MNINLGGNKGVMNSNMSASEPSLQIGTLKKNEDDDDDQMSDYIDENFEHDETDEYEGVAKHDTVDFTVYIANNNDIKKKTELTYSLKDNQELKKHYKYVNR